MSTWWRHGVFYQIYPLSYQDSNADGRGDLRGILRRLDHLEWLGVDAVWLSPVMRSPMQDFGYDISDFSSIDPVFGSMEDFDQLVAELHQRGIRLILDFVPNHTSDQHPWFQQSASSRHNPHHEWYVWQDPAPDGGPPNNWLSRFGGSAWQWHPATGQYYYHAFLKSQPDLNWRHPPVREAMAEVLRFWLNRGVDGFRIDACAVLAEDQDLRDEPPNPGADKAPPPEKFTRVFTDDRPESVTYLEGFRAVADEFPDRVLAGEVQGQGARIAKFYGRAKPALHIPLNHALLTTEWQVLSLQAAIDRYLQVLPAGGWPNWVLGGHDKQRLVSKIGPKQARVAALLLMTLPGTAFFYAGDEIGLPSTPIPPGRMRDPFERLVPGYGLSRDPARTPIPWDSSPHGGFSTVEPWLPLGDPPPTNVQAQLQEQKSVLHLYRQLIALRKKHFCHDEYRACRSQGDVLIFARGPLLVALNLSAKEQTIELPRGGCKLFSTHLDHHQEAVTTRLVLRPDEGVVIS